jgi:hypothetical protein
LQESQRLGKRTDRTPVPEQIHPPRLFGLQNRKFNGNAAMPQSSLRQRKTIGRVLHEYEHGELKSGRGSKGGAVKSRKQAIAIALHEAGTSSEGDKANADDFAKEARG